MPNKYYFKTLDNWLYLYDPEKEKNDIVSIKINDEIFYDDTSTKTDKSDTKIINSSKTTKQNVNNINIFIDKCIKKADKHNLRYGIKDIYKKYTIWCQNTNNILDTEKNFKDQLEIKNIKKEKSKGIDINGKNGKRGYNIDVVI